MKVMVAVMVKMMIRKGKTSFRNKHSFTFTVKVTTSTTSFRFSVTG